MLVSRDMAIFVHVTLFGLTRGHANYSEIKIARNEEKQQGRLNRLWLQREREGKRRAAMIHTYTYI